MPNPAGWCCKVACWSVAWWTARGASTCAIRPPLTRLGESGYDQGRTLPLEDGAAAFQYTRDLLLAAGCSAWKPRAVFGPRKPDQALRFVRAIQLGRTRPGSYV